MSPAMDLRVRNKDLNTTLSKVATGMKDVAVKGFNLEQAYRIYYTGITRSPKLLVCTNESLARCLVDAASLGLFIGGTLGQCYAVPFRNKNLRPPLDHEATFMLGYQGMIELMRRSGEIESVTSELVYEQDFFEHEKGLTEVLRHVPFGYAQSDRSNLTVGRGRVTHGYCIVRFKGGGHHIETMSTDEINARRSRSRAKDDGPWVTDWAAMARKTLVRASWPYVPKTPDILRAMALDEEVEAPDATMALAAQPAITVNTETGEVTEDAEQTATDRLVNELSAPKGEDAPPPPESFVPEEQPKAPEKAKATRSPKAKPPVARKAEAAPAPPPVAQGEPEEMFPEMPASPEDVTVDLQSAKDSVDKQLSRLERGHQNILIHTFCRKHGLKTWHECTVVDRLSAFYDDIEAFAETFKGA